MLDRCSGCKMHWGFFPPVQITEYDKIRKINAPTDQYRCVECKRVYQIECVELVEQ